MSLASPEILWYVARDGQQYGPMPRSDLDKLQKEGRVAPTDHLWCAELGRWAPASEIFGEIPSPPPPPSLRAGTDIQAGRVASGQNGALQPNHVLPSRQSQQADAAIGRTSPAAQRNVTQTVVEGGSFKFSTFILIVLGLIVPLWPISLPLFWFLAYRSYQKPSMQTVRVITE